VPKIERWSNVPQAVRDHLVLRLQDRKISINDLNQLRCWIDTQPDVPVGSWYKDFGSFKICGKGAYAKTFLLRGQAAEGESL